MKTCVQAVVSRTGTGVQTITGIVDQNGATFQGTFAFAIAVGAVLDTLSYQDGPNVTAAVLNQGADDGTNGACGAFGDIDQFFAKIVSSGDARRYSVGDYQPDIFFGGNWQGYGYVSAFRDGEVDITFDLNNRGGWGFLLVVLGGDDLIVDTSAGMSSGIYATSGAPVAVLAMSSAYAMGSTPAATTGAGGQQMLWGWDTRSSGKAVAAAWMENMGGNIRGQVTDRLWGILFGASFSGAAYVSSWDDLSYTIADGFVSACNRFAFSGVRAFADAVPLRTTPGLQVINVGMAARWVKVVTVGTIPGAAVDATQMQLCIGWSDGTRQGCAWIGETESGHPITGTRLLSSNALVRVSAGAAANLTTFTAVASLVDIDGAVGTITLDVTDTDGTPYEILLFVLGDPLESQPAVTGTTQPAWTLNRFDQKIRIEGPNGSPPPRAFGRPIDWVEDGVRWKLERCDLTAREEDTA